MNELPQSPFDPTAQDLDSKIVVALERLAEAFRVMLWEQGKTLGISPIQIQILVFLRYHTAERRSVSYLAREFNLTKPTISDAVRVLTQKGFVQKEPHATDSRGVVLHLTESGQTVAERTSGFAGAFRQALTAVELSEKAPFYDGLLTVIRQLTRANVIAVQRMCFSCRFYRYDPAEHHHFCALLNLQLEGAHLRVDCPEHQLAP